MSTDQEELPHFERCLQLRLLAQGSEVAGDLRALARLSLETRLAVHQALFADLSTEHAKLLIKSDAATFSDGFSSGLIYGEVNFSSFINILQRCKPATGETFVDLGHGTGKALVAAALCYGDVLSRIHGVEILAPLCLESQRRVQSYLQAISTAVNEELFEAHRHCTVTTELGDFLSSSEALDWTTADIVFVNSTCFDDALMSKIAERARGLRRGSRIATLTYSLPGEGFALIWKENLCMSWGIATAYIHECV